MQPSSFRLVYSVNIIEMNEYNSYNKINLLKYLDGLYMQEKKICFFIGHRDTPDSIYPALEAAVEKHIMEYGVLDFNVGHYGRFDALATRAVQTAKKRHPTVTLTVLLPYYPFGKKILMPEGCDGTFYPPDMETTPKRAAIVKANRYVVDNSTHLIAYARYTASNSKALLEYAQKREQRGLIHITLLTLE